MAPVRIAVTVLTFSPITLVRNPGGRYHRSRLRFGSSRPGFTWQNRRDHPRCDLLEAGWIPAGWLIRSLLSRQDPPAFGAEPDLIDEHRLIDNFPSQSGGPRSWWFRHHRVVKAFANPLLNPALFRKVSPTVALQIWGG